MEDLTGKQLGPYQIVGALGEGGMAAVYKAFQPSMNRYVALKILPRHLAGDPQFVARFQQEAKVLAQLQHPHILPIHDFGEADGYSYLVMPYVEGGTLLSLMKGEALPLKEVRRLVSQIGDALDYAHSLGLVHRDVKPSNVLLDPRGNCLLTDFGIAKIVESSAKITTTGGIVGTPAYMSPEQGLGFKLDGRSDQYSLGVILYELATGRAPYNAETPMAVVIKHINDPLPPPRTLNPELPASVERVILRALAKTPGDRFATVGDFVRALQAAIPETGVFPAVDAAAIAGAAETVTAERPAGGPGAKPARRGLVFAGIGLGLLAVVVAAFLILNGGGAGGSAATGAAAASQTAAALAAAPSDTPAPPATDTDTPPPTDTPAPATATGTSTPAPTATEAGPAATPTLGIGATQVSAVDGMVSVYVPAGVFRRGAAEGDSAALAYEKPQREVTLDAFWIDRTEVTNAQYAQCVAAGRCRALNSPNSATRNGYYTDPAFQDYPVIRVTWDDARNYCQWAGGRLPTEAEWEKAARGVDGRLFPWGDDQPGPARANFNRTMGDTAAADDYPEGVSVFGALNMAGNVQEWVSDWYQSDYYRTGPATNPGGPDAGQFRVLRGGSWRSPVAEVRATHRNFAEPTMRDNATGFRCAR